MTMARLITRTVYTPSDLKSMRIMQENSAVADILALSVNTFGFIRYSAILEWKNGIILDGESLTEFCGIMEKLEQTCSLSTMFKI